MIFFNSKNAVKHFFSQVNAADLNVKYAAFGQATATEILKYTSDVHFIGTSSDPDIVSDEFNSIYKISQRILFPCSTKSLKTVSTVLKNNHHILEVVVYDTIIKADMNLPEADVYVMTSPSNVQSFSNSLKKLNNKLIVSIGPSTAEALKAINVPCHAIAASADDLGIFHAIYLAKANQI
jgi:uroporphyrinogen-III synthase